jgi:hypothetical protein
VGMQVSTTTMESSMEIPQKTRDRTAIWSSVPLLGIYPKELKTPAHDVLTALFTIAKLWKQPRCPATDEWIVKLWYMYTMECYSAIRNDDMWFEGEWLQLADFMLSEVSQDQKDKGHVFSLIHWR